ncbi:MAG: hypothetical protein ACRC5T_11130 [Cetobacterium sp.]
MKEKEFSKEVAFWVNEIETYEREFTPWEKRGKAINKRYRDERGTNRAGAKFNILWSNVQVLAPATYSSSPNPNIDRRFEVKDDLGRYSSLVLERAVSFYVKSDDFHKIMKQVVLDRLLAGRGVAWVRYCPVFEESQQITDDNEDKEKEDSELLSEDVATDYVHWQDFGHTWARTWQEVRGVWRRVYMTRSELVKRFGEDVGNKIPLDAKLKGKDDNSNDIGKKATIYEIWDKSKKKACWLHKSVESLLDEQADPLGLKSFFPCPDPIYSTLVNDDLIPTPDFVLYQDQAIELDTLTARMGNLLKALKIAGVYDGRAQGIDRLLTEGVENKLIPVDQWAVFGDKGLASVISFMPLAEIIGAIQAINEAREVIKNDIYELTGISDIIRGASVASETATAQQIKGQYANLRLDDRQKDAARFAKDLIVIMTEIIAKHFSLDTIKAVSGVNLLTNAEKQQIQMQQEQAALISQQAQQPPQPLTEDVAQLMDMPSWEDVETLIRNDAAREFRIDIETDSTIKADQEAEKQARTEFLTAVSGFMQQAVSVPPQLAPLAMELLLFGVRGFKVSRELETSFEAMIEKMRKDAEKPQIPISSPEGEKINAEIAFKEKELAARLRGEAAKEALEKESRYSDSILKNKEFNMRERELAFKELELVEKLKIEKSKIDADTLKFKLDAKSKASTEVALLDADMNEVTPLMEILAQFQTQAVNTQQALMSLAQAQNNGTNAIIAALTQPKKVEIKRDSLGQMQSAEVING